MGKGDLRQALLIFRLVARNLTALSEGSEIQKASLDGWNFARSKAEIRKRQ